MVVNHNEITFSIFQYILHFIHTRIHVEVEAEDEISVVKQLLHFVRVLVITNNGLSSREPMKKIREGVGYDDNRFFAKLFRKIG